MGRGRILLVGLVAGLFFATSVAWFAGSAYAGPQVDIKIAAEEERPLIAGHTLPVQLKIEVVCPGGLLGPGCAGTVQCDYDPGVGPVDHPITSVTLNGTTLQFNNGALVEARWAFGVAADGQSLQAIVAAGTACAAAVVPATFVFRGPGAAPLVSDTIKSEITNKL